MHSEEVKIADLVREHLQTKEKNQNKRRKIEEDIYDFHL